MRKKFHCSGQSSEAKVSSQNNSLKRLAYGLIIFVPAKKYLLVVCTSWSSSSLLLLFLLSTHTNNNSNKNLGYLTYLHGPKVIKFFSVLLCSLSTATAAATSSSTCFVIIFWLLKRIVAKCAAAAASITQTKGEK